jgi:TolB-like protein/class 3 adenylate cyclase/cytochrome c-type biogenesis protein CcmH/NrfG
MGNEKHLLHPPSTGIERKLAAILSADVAGYSRLMNADEVGTLHTLNACREVTDSLIHQHRGRIVNTAGDSILAEFASAVDAVQCAVEIQQALKAKNADLPPERKMEFRIGINVGDVVVEGEQIYGDGVNVAARLQGLADVGGVFVSGTVYDQIENKLALNYEYLGEQEVKNIAKPVRVYRVVLHKVPSPLAGEGQGEGASRETGSSKFKVQDSKSKGESHKPRRVGTTVFVLVSVSVLLLGGIVIFLYPSLSPLITDHSSLVTPEAQPPLPLPDKPSLVVLPFVNMSGDPGQEYFSDGITEVLTNDLSQISSLFVIARNSAFTYKGRAVNTQDVGRELGVRYVVEGSVQKADDQVRVVAQLIDTTTGGHLWSQRYDRPLKDIFALQDEIVQKIVTTLKLQLTLLGQGYLARKGTDNPEAYDYFLRGLEYFNRFSKEANAQARQMYEKAIELDPKYAQAYVVLGLTYFYDWFVQWSRDSQNLERAFELAQKATALDDSLPLAHQLLGEVYLWKKQHEQALAEAERALALNPNDAGSYVALWEILTYGGQPAEGLKMIEKALRLNPHSAYYVNLLGWAYYWLGRYEEAVAAFKRAIPRSPNILVAHLGLAATYGALDREAEARAEGAEVLRISPDWSLEAPQRQLPFKDQMVIDRHNNNLRKAGLK